ncbi:MAG: hypothetical protein AB7N80_03305 [Bdellovibrionales bacterium]
MRAFLKVLPLLLVFSVPFAASAAKRNNGGYTCEKVGVQPEGPSCSEAACGLIGGPRFCNSDEEQREIASACSNNVDGRCLSNSCQIMGVNTCTTLDDIRTVAASCQGTCDLSCVSVGCGFLRCGNTGDMADVNLACSGKVSGECVLSACGASGGCGHLSGFQSAARFCGSQM